MRKLYALVLAAILLASFAMAENASPSITVHDAAKVLSVTSMNGVAIGDGFIVQPTEIKKQVQDDIDAFAKAIQAGTAAIDCFDEQTKEKIAQALPEETDLDALEVKEILSLLVSGYEDEYGDVEAVISFITPYASSQKLAVSVGVYANESSEDAEWYVLEAEALADGTVKVLFTQEALKAIQASYAATMVVLNTAA